MKRVFNSIKVSSTMEVIDYGLGVLLAVCVNWVGCIYDKLKLERRNSLIRLIMSGLLEGLSYIMIFIWGTIVLSPFILFIYMLGNILY